MKKSSLSWTLLLMVAATLSMPLYGLEVPKVTPAVPQAEAPVVNPAEPEKDAGLEAKLPDLFIQKPSFVCVSNWECEQQWGPGSLCTIYPGEMYGFCN